MKHRARHRGFILLAALAVLTIVGVAMLTLAGATVYDGQRTFDHARRAQLDQMLLAAANEAIEHLKQAAPKAGESWDVELPESLTEQSATLKTTVEPDSDANQIVLDVHAQVANRSAEQTLHFTRTTSGWKLAAADVSL